MQSIYDQSYSSSPLYRTQKTIQKKKSKKIILGKPSSKEKMTVEELKALSRQVKLPEKEETDDIVSISRHLRHNLTKAKYKMMDNLRKSNSEIYEYLLKNDSKMTCPSLSDDDCSSVSSSNTIEPAPPVITVNDIANLCSILYTPMYSSMLDLNLLLRQQSTIESHQENLEITEDQINSWLQRGGGGTISSIPSLATDQELADLLDFDS